MFPASAASSTILSHKTTPITAPALLARLFFFLRTTVIPNGDPGKLLMTCGKIRVGEIRGMPLSVVIERVQLVVWLRHAVNVRAIAKLAVRVFVDVISQVHNEIH